MMGRKPGDRTDTREMVTRTLVDQVASLPPEQRAAAIPIALDILGKLNNLPNTALGLAVGGAGYLYAQARGGNPKVEIRDNAIQFTNNPAAPVGAVTLGNTTIYGGDPRTRAGYETWKDREHINGMPVMAHERLHTYDGQILGGAYLPLTIGGLAEARFRDGDTHGPHNFMERPPMRPAQPRRPEDYR